MSSVRECTSARTWLDQRYMEWQLHSFTCIVAWLARVIGSIAKTGPMLACCCWDVQSTAHQRKQDNQCKQDNQGHS